MNIIPREAQPSDTRWEPAFLELAHGLVMAGAKARLIARLTQCSQRKVRHLYQTLRGIPAPAGPVLQATARLFAIPRAQTSSAWSIQCAIFLACYERIGRIMERPLHRGWQLLAAFNAYLSITEELQRATAVNRLDINQAYGLLTHCGFLEDPKAELQRRACPSCLITYLVVTSVPLRSQHCPVCSMDKNSRRLAHLRQSSTEASTPGNRG
jgi:hypothetical protein